MADLEAGTAGLLFWAVEVTAIFSGVIANEARDKQTLERHNSCVGAAHHVRKQDISPRMHIGPS